MSHGMKLLRSSIIALALLIFMANYIEAAEWKGIDETVVEKIAGDHGRKAADPLINTDKGDLLLFVFLIAGVGAGFMGGYYYRKLTENSPANQQDNGDANA